MNHENHTLENNPIAYKIIKNAFVSNKLSHAYLFSAQKDYIIEHEPLFLIKKLVSKGEDRDPLFYSDLTIIDGSKGEIKKENVVAAVERLQQTALDVSGIKVLLIKNVENGNSASLNSLLKFIEEPTKDTFIIMTTNALSSVLSTIRSRSQVVLLKSSTKKAFVSLLQLKGFTNQKAKLLAEMTSSLDQAIVMGNSEETDAMIGNLKSCLSKAIFQKQRIHSDFSPLIKKDNYKLSLSLISAFYNDVWKFSELIELTFEDEKNALEAYKSQKFDFEKALLLINDFLVKVNYNVNFDLYKNKFLIELGECYG